MKRALCALLSLVMAMTGFAVSVSAQNAEMLDGETSRSVSTLYHGVELTKYVLGSSSKYSIQEFSTVEFDPAQDDLYLEVVGGGQWANERLRTTDAVKRYNAENGEGKVALAAVNGDMWFMTSTHSRVEGAGTVYMGCSDPVVTEGLTIPRGFTMYGGEIICSTNMEQETPYSGSFQSFGISSDGEALLGDILCEISVKNKTTGEKILADGLNRLPADNALVMYTDKGYASNFSLSDAYEVVIDCRYDYVVRQGAGITGTVVAVVKPGEEKYPMADNRIILTARGDRISSLAEFKAGDTVSIVTEITDTMGNTEKWQSVTDCVGGHMPIVIDGVSCGVDHGTTYPTSVLGIKADGRVVMLTSYGRQGNSGYSYGFKISQLDELCEELGIVTAFMLDGGANAQMAVISDGEYELTGRPCNKNSDGSYGRESAVINSVILSYGESRTGADGKIFPEDAEKALDAAVLSNRSNAKEVGYSLALLATGEIDPNARFSHLGTDAFRGDSTLITARLSAASSNEMRNGSFCEADDLYSSVNTLYKQLEFNSTGEWLTKVIRHSDIDAWYGRIFDDASAELI